MKQCFRQPLSQWRASRLGQAGIIVSCILSLASFSGCANLKVKKVAVRDRLSGEDEDLKGFRYYLSRPYFVVKDEVVVGEHKTIAYLAHFTINGNRQLGLISIREDGSLSPLDLSGFPIEGRIEDCPDPVSLKPKAASDGTNPTGGEIATPGTFGGRTPTEFIVAPEITLGGADAEGETASEPSLGDSPIQVVSLPDFEEQYRVQSINCLAYSKYDLHFADGWSLTNVGGSFDSTQVAEALISSIGNIITQAAGAEAKRITELLPPESDGGPNSIGGQGTGQSFWVIRTFTIEPGLYRLQKPQEVLTTFSGDAVAAAGVLSSLGLPVAESVSVTIVTE